MNEKKEVDLLNTGVSAVYWIKIFLSPFLIGLIAAVAAVLVLRSAVGVVAGVLAIILGAVFGYRMAENARKTTGTVAFSARTMSNTEFTNTNKKA